MTIINNNIFRYFVFYANICQYCREADDIRHPYSLPTPTSQAARRRASNTVDSVIKSFKKSYLKSDNEK